MSGGIHGTSTSVPPPIPPQPPSPCSRILKTPSPHIGLGSSKPGPMKATIPISGVIKPICSSTRIRSPILIEPQPPPLQSSYLASSPHRCYSSSSSSSWWSRTSSPGGERTHHHHHTSGQRSPGSASTFSIKGKSLNSDIIRRTASLDTIYLKGQWTRDNYYGWGVSLQVDKATQTDEIDSVKDFYCFPQQSESPNFNIRSNYWLTTKEPKRLAVSPTEHHHVGTTCSDTSSQTCASSYSIYHHHHHHHSASHLRNSLIKPLPKTSSSIRSSVEGLNQEIERIVLQTEVDTEKNLIRQNTPEGRRAPLAELLRYTTGASKGRSVDTQTPQEFSSHSSSGSSPENETTGNSSSKLGTSPQINKFLAREPPDGCEKVRLKSLDDERNPTSDHLLLLQKHKEQQQQQQQLVGGPTQLSTFKLKPSLGSAFQILQPKFSPSEDDGQKSRVEETTEE